MLNRLMFVYFIQQKGFLDGDTRYLQNRLALVRQRRGKGKFLSFYRYFLRRLFHEGFAQQQAHRSPALEELLGQIPYLNGGLFEEHALEQQYDGIDIPDEAFERLFAFFDQYHWHLDERPLRDDREINPDVLGYIFEKYINQKQMGAYYTKEDITDYISRNTIIPWLFDAAREKCAIAFQPDSALWRLLRDDPDRYIYRAVRQGVIDDDGEVIPLPDEIAAGIDDVSRRDGWNRPADSPYALPTETWREHVARRQRCLELREKLRAGEVHEINDLITYNLNIAVFAEDAIRECEGSDLLRAFYRSLEDVTVLDPTCGSGAFLFAALNLLEPLYEACLDRMQAFVDDRDQSGRPRRPDTFSDFRRVLAELDRHPNNRHFILKTIVVRNLYGVDLMEEAVEICKLRLFLKLVAQVERIERLEPLPDIDFNIRAGNTLVGFATLNDVRRTVIGTLADDELKAEVARIVHDAEQVEHALQRFHAMQTDPNIDARQFTAAKQTLSDNLQKLTAELDRYFAGEYGIDPTEPKQYAEWRETHHPFHWFAEFYGIMNRGGFDVVIGNPPYVEYSKVRSVYTVHDFDTLACGNLYALVLERCKHLLNEWSRLGLILPLSLLCTDRMAPARRILVRGTTWIPAFDIRPASLFEGVSQRLCILLNILSRSAESATYAGGYRRWSAAERENLIALTQFTQIRSTDRAGAVPKVSLPMETAILEKIDGPKLETAVDPGSTFVYVHRICRYFIKALNFIPLFVGADGKKGKSDDYKPFCFQEELQGAILCLLNSTLFYWFWRAHGDGFHCGYGDVYRMPFRGDFSPDTSKELSALLKKLMSALVANSQVKTITTKKGKIQYQEFYPKSTKPILDAIDRTLARHHRFSDNELDFVLNYDIKYRMGIDED